MLDTGKNIAESWETLVLQQGLLKRGYRDVQMFPVGTPELKLPDGFGRVENERGVFHYNPERINPADILELSKIGHENEFLDLGPVSKPEVELHLRQGFFPIIITEYSFDGIEVRTVAGSTKTLKEQFNYVHSTRQPGSLIAVNSPPQRLVDNWRKKHGT